MRTYNSDGYGAYHISKFVIDLNRTVVLLGDFHRYILSDLSDYIQRPWRTGEDPFHIFSGADVIDEIPKNSDNILKSMYTVFHETTHLMQDFTLGSEMLRDSLYDLICGQSFAFIKLFEMHGKQLPLPLMQLEGYLSNKKTSALRELYDTIYNGSIYIDMPSPDEPSVQLGTTDLVEAYAAAKAFHFMMVAEPASAQDNRLNYWFHNSNLSDVYRKAWSVYEKALTLEKNPYRGGTPTRNQLLDITAFLLVCDIALHISPAVLSECLSVDEYEVPEYFLPYCRFIRIEQTLARNNGFPEAVEGEDFYVTLFDFVAKHNGWPTFRETSESWLEFFAARMHRGFMVSDGYRMLCTNYKINYANELIAGPPGAFFVRNGVPVLVRYYKGSDSFFEYFRPSGFGQMTVMDNSLMNPLNDIYAIMENEVFRNPWNAGTFFDELGKKTGALWTFEAGTTFLREIFCRILSKEFYRAVQGSDYFSCPLAGLRCLSKTDACSCLKRLTKLPERCCLAKWLEESNIRPDSLYWR